MVVDYAMLISFTALPHIVMTRTKGPTQCIGIRIGVLQSANGRPALHTADKCLFKKV
jgi:hypothetical protein